jgi:serine/threonine-protein kinase RsbT
MISSTGGGELPIRSGIDIVVCRQTVRRLTAELGFSVVGQTMLVTATSELARNTLIHGGGGRLNWEVLRPANKIGLRLIFSDEGPGIPNMRNALTEGWTSARGMGLGLTGSKRLTHEFEIESRVAKGTKVSIVRWR